MVVTRRSNYTTSPALEASASPLTSMDIRQSASTKSSNDRKPTIAIIGSGWAGWTLAQDLKALTKTHDIVILSPTRTMALTPLLASAACSIFDFRLAEEPVRRLHNTMIKYQVHVQSVDLKRQSITCKPAIGSNGDERGAQEKDAVGSNMGDFEVHYDTLVLAPGSEMNTFGTRGVKEHCLSLKSVADAQKLRERMLDCLELASLPNLSLQEKKDILHFAIVGGGPTGVELAAEIDEVLHDHLAKIYGDIADLITVSVYDIADRMLGQFDKALSEYAMEKFKKRKVQVRMGKHIQSVDKSSLHIKEDGEVKFGFCVWATGNKALEFVEALAVEKSEGAMERVLTDQFLHVLKDKEESEVLDNVYALGDAADIDGASLPTTAEVAVQKAKWLAKHLQEPQDKPFKYEQKQVVAYIGRQDGIVEGRQDWTGASAWLAWRSGSLAWTRSWRRRAMVLIYWFMNKLDGREIARR